MKHYLSRLKPRLPIVGSSLLLLSPSVLAHNGHNHAQFDSLNGILHVLTTHPLMFGAVGLIFIAAIMSSNH